jgi:hypothetical protein
MKVILVIALVVALVILGPFASIWALNTFGDTLWPGRQIPYTFDTWLAAIIIAGIFKSTITKKD